MKPSKSKQKTDSVSRGPVVLPYVKSMSERVSQ